MFTTTILMIAMIGQAPTLDRPVPERPARRMTQKQRIAAKKAAQARWGREQDRAEYMAAQKAQKDAQAAYEKALPFMLEQQRQAIQRQGDIERNAALERIARAAESEARTYEWNSYYNRRPR